MSIHVYYNTTAAAAVTAAIRATAVELVKYKLKLSIYSHQLITSE